MTYIVTENCIACKYMDCVEVCPVDCFYEGENFLVIHPDECIDCGVCEPECPVDAIKPDTEDDPTASGSSSTGSTPKMWPNVTVKGCRLPTRKRSSARRARWRSTSPRRRAGRLDGHELKRRFRRAIRCANAILIRLETFMLLTPMSTWRRLRSGFATARVSAMRRAPQVVRDEGRSDVLRRRFARMARLQPDCVGIRGSWSRQGERVNPAVSRKEYDDARTSDEQERSRNSVRAIMSFIRPTASARS